MNTSTLSVATYRTARANVVTVDFADGAGPEWVLVFDDKFFKRPAAYADKAVRLLTGKDEAGVRAELARISAALAA